MPTSFALPPAAVPAEISRQLPPQIVSPCASPPEGEGWLHEIKHDGHRLLAIVDGGELRLISRNGRDRAPLFREPFDKLVAAGLPPLVLDGEIAVPDQRDVTHIDLLTQAMRQRRPERLAYFSFDLLHLDGHDLRLCAIEDPKALLRDVIGAAGCERIVVVDHVVGNSAVLFEAVRQIGAEGVVSKRSPYRGGESRDWLKAKVSETGTFVITGNIKHEAIAVAELRNGMLAAVGMVKFGLGGKELWPRLEQLRTGTASRGSIVTVRPKLVAGVKFFGRYRSGAIRDGVLLSVG